jgi:hypothetical protein
VSITALCCRPTISRISSPSTFRSGCNTRARNQFVWGHRWHYGSVAAGTGRGFVLVRDDSECDDD